jgi:hypothetical protein
MNGEEWREDALCRQVDPDLWYPEKGDNGMDAKAVCAACPVAGACLEYAVTTFQQHGVWGGKTYRELARIRKERGLLHPCSPTRWKQEAA